MKLSERIFGTHSARELKRIMPIVDKIESLRPDMQKLTDDWIKEIEKIAEKKEKELFEI